MESSTPIDPRIYGGSATPTAPLPTIEPVEGAGAGAQPFVAPAPVPFTDIRVGATAVQEGKAALEAANRPEPTIGEAMKAGVKAWDTTRILDAINMPKFAAEADFDVKPYIRQVPFQLAEHEQKFLAVAKSEEEYQYKLDLLEKQRDNAAVMSQRPWIAGAVGIADPIWLGIDIASLGTASAATRGFQLSRVAGRTIAAATAGAASYGASRTAQQAAAIEDSDVIFNTLLNASVGAAFFNPKTRRLEKMDPTFPADELATTIRRGTDGAPPVEARVASEVGDVNQFTRSRTAQAAEQPKAPLTPEQGALAERMQDAPRQATLGVPGTVDAGALARYGARNLDEATDAYTLLARHEADADFGPMIRVLREKHGESLAQVVAREGDVRNPFYTPDNGTMYVDRKADAFQVLHEAIHGLTSNKLAYGRANPGTAHGRLVTELEELRKTVAAFIDKMPQVDKADLHIDPKKPGSAYFTQNVDEFVAGLFAGKNDGFARIMASIPAQGSRTALTKMIGVVRKLLGVPPKSESALTKALGIADELMRTKLTVKGDSSDFVKQHFAPSGTPAQINQQVAGWWDTQSKRAGSKIEWSLNRNLRSRGTNGNKVADILVDDPINMTGDSAVSQRHAIRAELATKQAAYEEHLKEMMATQGIGMWQRVFQANRGMAVQGQIEADLATELIRRDNLVRKGLPTANSQVDPELTKLADLHDAATAAGINERKAAGVRGADLIEAGSGYFHRKWDVTKLEDIEGRFLASGMGERAARKSVRELIATGIQRADGTMPRDVAEDIALAITERTRRKGYFEDAANMGTMGDDGAQGIRAILHGSGLDKRRMDQIEEFMSGRKDDAGVASSLKHRVAMDLSASAQLPDGTTVRILDLVDTNLTRGLDTYLDDAAGSAGLARKGLVDNSDIVKLRKEFLEGIASESERKISADLFDNTIKAIKGQPVGEDMGRAMRNLQAVTTSVGLANSGMWQVMEFANVAAKYGLVKTATQAISRLPILKQLIGQVAGSVDEAGSMAHVLSHNSNVDLRIRPFVAKMEDNFSIAVDDRLTLGLQQAKQLVPYINAMKYVHHAQANMTANLITDLVKQGANKKAGAREMLAKYGLEGHQLDRLKIEIDQHGMTVDKWADGVWADVRGPLNKMMDDAVLKNRTGELPAFAQFSTLGKFIFTFRSFVLGSHNKVLAGTMGRHGFAGLGLLMAYQFPLAMATTYAVGAARGKPESDMNKLAMRAIGQQSAMGLFTELFAVMSGNKQQFGASGLMAIDRLYKTTSQAAQGEFGNAAFTAAQTVPLLAILPGIKALAEQAK